MKIRFLLFLGLTMTDIANAQSTTTAEAFDAAGVAL